MAKTIQKPRNAGWEPFMAGAMGMSRWQPGAAKMAGPRLGQSFGMTAEQRQMMGIAILSALSIAGLHSAVCPSYFTMKTFASQPEAKSRAMEGLWISLGISSVASLGLYFVFDRWLPAIVAEATAVALFGIGVWAVNSQPPDTIPPMEKQAAANPGLPAPAPVQATATQV
jgi:hypothetical protein